MTAGELVPLIGKLAYARLSSSSTRSGSVRVEVTIVDARNLFGRTDVLVEPMAGSGQLWMDLDAVEIHDPSESE